MPPSMEYVREMGDEEVKKELTRFKGVGPKTVAPPLPSHPDHQPSECARDRAWKRERPFFAAGVCVTPPPAGCLRVYVLPGPG